MSYTVKQLARLAGISVRTLHFYDEIGLLRPGRAGPGGYRVYDQAAVLRLQQILFYKELGLSLEASGQVLEAPDFDVLRALQAHRRALQALSLSLQLLAALAAAHERGLVHSALHPQHVLMGRDGQLKIEEMLGTAMVEQLLAIRPGTEIVVGKHDVVTHVAQPRDCLMRAANGMGATDPAHLERAAQRIEHTRMVIDHEYALAAQVHENAPRRANAPGRSSCRSQPRGSPSHPGRFSQSALMSRLQRIETNPYRECRPLSCGAMASADEPLNCRALGS